MRIKLSVAAFILMFFHIAAGPVKANPLSGNTIAVTPLSKTAFAILGPLLLAEDRIVFEDGRVVGLALETPARIASWDGMEPRAGQVFRLLEDPGERRNGNHLCGDAEARWIVASVNDSLPSLPMLVLSVFSGETEPLSATEGSLCGTYNFSGTGIQAAKTQSPKPPAANGPPPAQPGRWQLSDTTNPLDDTRTVVLSLTAESGTSRMGDKITFIARCKSNKTEAYVIWNDYLGDDSRSVYNKWKYVTVRIGEKAAERQRWGVSTDNQATFAPDWAGTLLKSMLDQERMVLQTTPYNANPMTAIFDIRGLREALPPLAETCNWSF